MENKLLQKEYSIPFELFKKSFEFWQKKFVYPRVYYSCIIFCFLGCFYIYSIVKDPSRFLSYVLMGLCFGMAGINWYNPKKLKRTLLESIKELDDERYKFTMFETYVEIATIIQPDNTSNDIVDETDNTENELFDDDNTSNIVAPTKIYFNDNLKSIEFDEFFIIYQVKQTYYVVPKDGFTEEELEIFRKKFVI